MNDNEVIHEFEERVRRVDKFRWLLLAIIGFTSALLIGLIMYAHSKNDNEMVLVLVFIAAITIPNYIQDLKQHKLNKKLLMVIKKEISLNQK